MIHGAEPISSTDFNKGLVTRSDFLKGDINASPNTMDVTWNFDASLHKRFGYSSTNTITLIGVSSAGWTLDTTTSLSVNLNAYWKLDEATGIRYDQVATLNLNDLNADIFSIVGIRGQAANYSGIGSDALLVANNSSLQSGTSNFSISTWVYVNTFGGGVSIPFVFKQNNVAPFYTEYNIQGVDSGGGNVKFAFTMVNTSGATTTIFANSIGNINTATWYNIIAWHSNNSHIGISVNLSPNSATFLGGGSGQLAPFQLGGQSDNGISSYNGRIDETGFWGKVLSSTERSNLYGGGTGNTFSGAQNSQFTWASFDFGASGIRWLTIAAGTGLLASSNLGTTFVNITTGGAGQRTQNYQSLTRSKNVLIATSDSYDSTLYWAGSAGTTTQVLAPNSAPAAKFATNYQGFLILLNFMNSNGTIRNRGFAYADENLQLTDTWGNSFDIPSSADDEITASFILYKFLYISTRYTIYRVAFTGGNPDWTYLKIKDWGFVPRTVSIVSLKGGGQVAIGMDWDRRLRAFDGFDDMYISDNIENDNGICDFAMQKVSYAGSGLVVSHAVLNPVRQEYRLNLAIGPNSTQTTHGIILNARNLAMYPYSNQPFQTMCMAQSNNQNHLMAADRSGFVYILDSGNLDVKTPINENYDSPPLFSKLPEMVSKGQQLNMYFTPISSGIVYYQERFNLSNTWSPMKRLADQKGIAIMTGTENSIKLQRGFDLKATYNTYQFRLTSSAGTALPWQMDRLDFLQQGFGIGQG